MPEEKGHTGNRFRQPEVLRQRTARQLWRTLAVAFPGVFTDECPRRGDLEDSHLPSANNSDSQADSLLSLLGTPVVNSLVAFVGQAVLGAEVASTTDLDADSEGIQNFVLCFQADCEENSPQYWELRLNLRSRDGDIRQETCSASLVDGAKHPLTKGSFVVFADSTTTETWTKTIGSNDLSFNLDDLKAMYMCSLNLRFANGRIQSGKLASVTPVS